MSTAPRRRFGSTGGEHGHALVDVVELTYRGRKIKAPVWIQPGHADGAITAPPRPRPQARRPRRQRRRLQRLRTAHHEDAPWFDGGLEARKLPDEAHTLACTQMHHNMEERRPIRTAPLEHFKKHPHFADELTAAEAEKPEVLDQVPGPQPQGRAEEELEKDEKNPTSRLVPLTLYDAERFEKQAIRRADRADGYQVGDGHRPDHLHRL